MLAGVWSRVRPSSTSGIGQNLRREGISRYAGSAFSKANAHTLRLSLPSRTLAQAPATEENGGVNARNVFEDPSSDYVNVEKEFKPIPPPVAELVQRTLPSLLPKPDIHDNAVFEDITTEDYMTVLNTQQEYINPSSVSDSLRTLIETGNLDEAYHILQEAQAFGIQVQQSFAYLGAAWASLLPSSKQTFPEQIKKALTWLSLLPPRSLANSVHLGLFRKLLLRSPFSNLPAANAVSIALARKGFGEAVSAHVIPFFIRHASTEEGLAFVFDFEQANREYCEIEHPCCDLETQDFVTKIRSAAIKTFVHSGRIEAALKLLPDPSNPQFRLTSRTYDTLIAVLRRDKVDDLTAHDVVVALRGQESACVESTKLTADDRPDTKELRALVVPWSPSYVGPKATSRLTKILHSLKRDELPQLSVITDFLHYCFKLRRTNIIPLLRQVAIDTHPSVASHFLLAEMMSFMRRREYTAIIELFVEYFYCTDVPAHELVQYCPQVNVDLSTHFSISSSAESLHAVQQHLHRPRLWPTHSHTDIVWQALVHLSPSDEAACDLYDVFLQVARRRSDLSGQMPPVYLSSPSYRSRTVDTEAFTSFIARLGRTPERCAQMFNDMISAGIIPSIHHFTHLAGTYARSGRTAQAFYIVDLLEKAHPQQHPVPMKTRELAVEESLVADGEDPTESRSVAFQRDPKDKLPKPDLIFYTCLATMFLKAKHSSAAVAIFQRLNDRILYRVGEHPPLDMAFEALEKQQQRRAQRAHYTRHCRS